MLFIQNKIYEGKKMSKENQYLKKVQELYNSGKINEEVYNSMIQNVDVFCEDEETDTYAEIEYADFENAEAQEGASWEDRNFLWHRER